MRNKLGILCMALGTVLLLAALSLFVANRIEENQAAEAVESLMPQIIARIEENRQPSPETAAPEPATEAVPDAPTAPETIPSPETTAAAAPSPLLSTEMAEAEIDGYGYIGYLALPTLNLALPVMADWDYDRLKIAPCRYAGTTMTDDLVIAAHDYARHFGKLSTLSPGDAVTFTDMNGRAVLYTVVAVDILPATAIAEMTAGAYDLTMFTCTSDGKSRVTVRCDRAE